MKRIAIALALTLLAACASETDDATDSAKLEASSKTPAKSESPGDGNEAGAAGTGGEQEPCIAGRLPQCASSCCSQPGRHYSFDEAAGCRRDLGKLYECKESAECGFFELVDCGVLEDGTWFETGSQQNLPHLPCAGNVPDEHRNAPLCD